MPVLTPRKYTRETRGSSVNAREEDPGRPLLVLLVRRVASEVALLRPSAQRVHAAEEREEDGLRDRHRRDVLEPPRRALREIRGVTNEAIRTAHHDAAVREVRELEP